MAAKRCRMNRNRTSLKPQRIAWAILPFVATGLAATSTMASVVLSNLGETSTSSGPVTSSSIGGWAFTTGPAGSTVNSVTLVLGTATDTSSEFVLRIRTDNGGLPGSSTIMGLVGSTAPSGDSGGSPFTYTPLNPSFVLSPNTTYWLTMGAKPGTGSYSVLTTSSDTFSTASGWSGSTSTWLSLDSAASWTVNTTDIPMVAFDVTAVPEPSSYATAAGIALAAAAWMRRRSRA
jgi:hypothetical protein